MGCSKATVAGRSVFSAGTASGAGSATSPSPCRARRSPGLPGTRPRPGPYAGHLPAHPVQRTVAALLRVECAEGGREAAAAGGLAPCSTEAKSSWCGESARAVRNSSQSTSATATCSVVPRARAARAATRCSSSSGAMPLPFSSSDVVRSSRSSSCTGISSRWATGSPAALRRAASERSSQSAGAAAPVTAPPQVPGTVPSITNRSRSSSAVASCSTSAVVARTSSASMSAAVSSPSSTPPGASAQMTPPIPPSARNRATSTH